MEGRKKERGRASEQESGVVPVSTASWARAENGGGGSRAVVRGGMTCGPAWRLDARGGGALGAWAGTAEKVAVGLPDGWAARRALAGCAPKQGQGMGKERWLGGPRDGPSRERGRK
jgi:hypothetical protein